MTRQPIDQAMPLNRRATVALLPKVWVSGPTTRYHVATLCGVPGTREIESHATMGVRWPPRHIERHIATAQGDESLADSNLVPRTSWCMVLYRGEDTSSDAPTGFLAFTPTLSQQHGQITALDLDIHLAWTTPKIRHKGYGRHMAANLARYLSRHAPLPGAVGTNTSPALQASITMPTPDAAAIRFVDYIKEFFTPGRSPRWNASGVTMNITRPG